MEWFIALLAVIVLGLTAVAASGGLGQLGPIRVDRRPFALPKSQLTASDVSKLRFHVVPRGYAMDEVDQVLERLQSQLEATSHEPESENEPESGIIETHQLS